MTLPIRGASLGNPDDTVDIAIRRGAQRPNELRRYARQLWTRCAQLSIRADSAFAQGDLETGTFTSTRWTRELNPAGLGITTGMPDSTIQRALTPEEWADCHAVHLAGYAGIDPGPALRALDFRWQAMVDRGWFGVAATMQDLDERWAEDGPQQYGDAIERRWRNYSFAAQERWTPPVGGTEGRPDVATKPYSTLIPGIPGGPVPTIAPVRIKLIPEWRTLNRPGITANTPRRSVQHGNGNSNSTAAGEANYLYNGAGGRQASYHSSTDDKETWVMVPGNEVTWQAADGSGPGNMNGYSNEMVEDAGLWASASRRMACIRNTADFMGTIAARLNIAKPERHWDFNYNLPPSQRHDCPNKLKYTWIDGKLAWDIYSGLWYEARDAERVRMLGGDVAEPEPDVIEIGDTLRTLVSLNMRQTAGLAAPVIATLPIGAEVVVSGRWSSADGYGWLPVRHTFNSGTVEGYVAQGDASGPYLAWVKSAPVPEPEPEYVAAKPIPALLETDLHKWDTAEGITTDAREQDFVFVADVIEFTAITVAGEYAVKEPRPVRAPYQVGERAIAAWLVKSQDTNSWWYVLTGAGNEWARVPYENTKRISDAPLLGDDMHAEAAEPEAA